MAAKLKPACLACGSRHSLFSVTAAIGRFTPGGPTGYKARNLADSPTFATREEAEAFHCQTMQTRKRVA